MNSQTYTILWRGQTSGPYSVEQIEQMLANRQVSLSHQVNDEGKMVFVEDFLAGKQAEGAQLKAEAAKLKAEQEAKVAETKAQAEHQRQKELMGLEIARTQAAAPPPPMVGAPQSQGAAPTWDGQSDNDEEGSSSGVLEGIFMLVVIGALGVGGWYAYKHFSGPTIKEVEAMTMSRMTLNYIANGHPDFIVKSVTLNKRNKREYYGSSVITLPGLGNANVDLEITLDGDKVTIVSAELDN